MLVQEAAKRRTIERVFESSSYQYYIKKKDENEKASSH